MTQPPSLRDARRLAGAVLFALCAVTAQDAAKSPRWQPSLCMQYRAVSSVAISPDGSRVAFVVRTPRMAGKQSEYRSHVWVANTDGSGARQFTRGAKSASNPDWSPDGNWLAFQSGRADDAAPASGDDEKGPKTQIWVLPMAGGEARPVTDAEAGVGSFRWSPGGTRIAYTMRDPETKAERKRKREKRDVELVDQEFKYSHVYVTTFDPTSDEIAPSVRLTGGEMHVTGFDWAPDGKRIAFSHQVDPRINTGRLSGDISIVTLPGDDVLASAKAVNANEKDPDDTDDADDTDAAPVPALGRVESLVGGAGVERSPYWSPDGRWIAYVSTGTKPEPIGLGDLYLIAAGGGEARRLAPTPNRSASILAWNSASDAIYLSEALGTTRHVIAVPRNGEAIRQLTTGDAVIGSASFSADGARVAFTHETSDTPANVWVTSTAEFAPTRCTDLHRDVPRPRMGATRLLSWKAPDGGPVEGLLTLPVDYERGRRYPLILNVHGGPGGVYTQGFTGAPSIYMLQYFAQQGFAILRPNPRGSTGYGKDFRYANVKDWGYGDLSDLLAGCDHVIELGIGDADRQFLMGWSYGGYMTSFAVTQTDRFRAASMGAGLPNLISMTTTTDIGDYLTAHMGGEFWDDYATYEKHSAIYHIKNVKTPTQVIHGSGDLRVPFTQGQEFYRALQRRRVPTEMVVYPRTPHGPREPKFLMDVSGRILTWFRKHMPAADGAAEAGHARERRK